MDIPKYSKAIRDTSISIYIGGVNLSLEYFDLIVKRLSREDLTVLEVLREKQATMAKSSMPMEKLQDESEMSRALLRKTVYRLNANYFIEPEANNKTQSYYLTSYGEQALNKIIELEGVN
jgi:predicted transcriptional regulator